MLFSKGLANHYLTFERNNKTSEWMLESCCLTGLTLSNIRPEVVCLGSVVKIQKIKRTQHVLCIIWYKLLYQIPSYKMSVTEWTSFFMWWLVLYKGIRCDNIYNGFCRIHMFCSLHSFEENVMLMKLKLNKIVYLFNWFCVIV